jgi:hypothetical protein
MGRDIRIEEVNGGFMLRAYEPTSGEMYPTMDGEQNSLIVVTGAEVKEAVANWLDKKVPPFKKADDGQK